LVRPTTDTTAGKIFSHLPVLAEIVACAIPTANRFYWHDGDRRTALKGVALMCIALTVVFFAASGLRPSACSTTRWSGSDLSAHVRTDFRPFGNRSSTTALQILAQVAQLRRGAA
jgi:hypothetical protein